MGKQEKENLNPIVHKDHKPITRRDFLAQGFIAYSATTMVPSLFGNMMNAAYGEDCPNVGGKKYIPFLVFDCAGGAALPANFLVTNEKGDLLPSYNQLGWDPKPTGALNSAFGLPMAANNVSQILAGIVQRASVDARAKLRMGSFCHFAEIDTSRNPSSAMTLISKSGYAGKFISRGLGNRNTVSGGNSSAALADAALKPVFVASVNDVKGSIGVGGIEPFSRMTPDTIKALLGASKDLTADQVKKFEASAKGKLLAKLAKCSYLENENLLSSNLTVDARLDTVFQQVYGINANTTPTLQTAVFSTLVMNTLRGNSGPSALTIGGCDYHNNTSTLGDAKDLEIGGEIGRAVEAAHRLQTPLFFQLITDGGCSNQVGTRIWRSDSGDKCMTVIGYYNPANAPTMRRTQVGWFTDGQGAARDALTGLGNSPSKVACAVLANYLKLQMGPNASMNQVLAAFNAIVPRGTFKDDAEVEASLIFG